VLLGIATASQSQTPSPGERETLRRLPGLLVVVGGITPEAEQDGLHKDAIKKTWSVSCSQQGSRCFPGSPLLPHRRLPTVRQRWPAEEHRARRLRLVSAGHGEAGRHAGVGETCRCTTWSIGLVGVSSSRLLSQLRSDIKDLVDTLINDWTLANAKR